MQEIKELENALGFHLVHVNVLDRQEKIVRTSYEVVDPTGDVIGRFGSLKEAQNFINLLCNLTPEEVEVKDVAQVTNEAQNIEKKLAEKTKLPKRRFKFKFI